MDTYFAPAERLSDDELIKEIELVSQNSIIDGLMHSVSGLLAVLNEHRQIVTLNESLLEAMGLGNADEVLGLRMGEALKCIHSCEMPGGCGTSEYCSTCGAAIAMVSSLATDKPVEKNCALTVERAGKKQDLFFRVRCVPIAFNGTRLLLLFMQDITYQQRLAALEKTFFHDINNMISGLLNASYLLAKKGKEDIQYLSQFISKISLRLSQEVALQRCLSQKDASVYQPTLCSILVEQVFQEIKDFFSNHPVSTNKLLIFPEETPDVSTRSDLSLVLRVLNNMIINAFEETEAGGEVKVWVEPALGEISFCVWNRKPVPPDIAKRIFQRNFSTKSEAGRGLGTYSMKLFGEEILGGHVDFSTSEADGTVFRFSLKK